MNKNLFFTHPSFFNKAYRQTALLLFTALFFSNMSNAAPESKLITYWNDHDAQSARIIDHSSWQTLLDQYLDSNHPSGINRVDYGELKKKGHPQLQSYLDQLTAIDPRKLNRQEQMAYWINLYNALTVDLIVRNYPTKSIRKVGEGFFSFGPWDDEITSINGRSLTLNEIEHGILRPIFKDNRIHYAVNCASLGCPNLAAQAYTSNNTEKLLETSARDYINHPRGVSLEDDHLVLSSIFDWYAVDFGNNEQDLLKHLIKYANKELAGKLDKFSGDIDYEYDWGLNRP